jgi:predicted phage tail protein
MSDKKLLSEILLALNHNQMGLGAAIEELANWAEANGGGVAAGHARDALQCLDLTLEVIVGGAAQILSSSDTEPDFVDTTKH